MQPQVLTYGWYATECLVLYVVLGVAWYFLDSTYGVKIYRWLHDISHKKPMPTEVVRGFIYGQPTKRQASVAFIISTVQSIYMVWGQNVNLLVELILWLLEVPAMLIGVSLGVPIYKLFQKRDKVFATVDKAKEQAEHLDLEEVRKRTEGLSQQAVGGLTIAIGSFGSFCKRAIGRSGSGQPASADVPDSVVAPEAQVSKPPLENPREVLRKYTGR